jgi:hypothetical protein
VARGPIPAAASYVCRDGVDLFIQEQGKEAWASWQRQQAPSGVIELQLDLRGGENDSNKFYFGGRYVDSFIDGLYPLVVDVNHAAVKSNRGRVWRWETCSVAKG